MLFNSLEYILLFLPVVTAVYFLFNHYRWPVAAKIWLVIASFVFYCRLVPLFGVLLFASILFNYVFGRWIHRQQKQAAALLAVAIVCNVAVLGYFKYANFWLTTWPH